MPYATSAIPWPMDAAPSVKIDFSTSEPLGAALRTTDFSDEVRFTNGERVPVGSLVEAYVDDALCEMASIRSGGFTGYISVVGPDSRPECHEGGTITFLVAGTPAVETKINSPEESTHLDLTAASS